jgi:hypothetical protein
MAKFSSPNSMLIGGIWKHPDILAPTTQISRRLQINQLARQG